MSAQPCNVYREFGKFFVGLILKENEIRDGKFAAAYFYSGHIIVTGKVKIGFAIARHETY